MEFKIKILNDMITKLSMQVTQLSIRLAEAQALVEFYQNQAIEKDDEKMQKNEVENSI